MIIIRWKKKVDANDKRSSFSGGVGGGMDNNYDV